MSDTYHIHPWQMIDLTAVEYAAIAADLREKAKAHG